MNKGIYIFDLDGTLCDLGHRLHYIQHDKPDKDWDAFHAACVDDAPKYDVIRIAQLLKKDGYEIVICSGRMDSVKEQTEHWLEKYGVKYDKIFMRPEGNYTPDDELKMNLLTEGHLGNRDNIIGVFDDRQRVVDMWRAKGLTCFQVEAWKEKA